MFCWLYFIPALCSVKKLKQEVLLDQFCLHLAKWSIITYWMMSWCGNCNQEDRKMLQMIVGTGLEPITRPELNVHLTLLAASSNNHKRCISSKPSPV